MGWFKKLTGTSSKSLGGVIGAVGGAFLGGPEGASVGYSLGNSLLGGSGDSYKDIYKYQLKNNIALWNMQNAYNTPKEQMLRFKEANLNPNLIYGQTNTASPISTSNLDVNNSGQQQQLSNYMALSNLGIQKDLSSAQVRSIDNSIDMSRLNYGLARDRLALDRDKLELERDMANAGWLGSIFGRQRGSALWDWFLGSNSETRKIMDNVFDGV